MTYSVLNIFHATQLVRDLPEAKKWFSRVFARPTLTWADRWDLKRIAPDYPVDYSFMIPIADLVHDALCPTLYRPPNSDSVLWDDVTEGLAGISWWIRDSRSFSTAMTENKIRLRDQSGNLVKGGDFSPTLITPTLSLMTTAAEDAGFAHSFSELLPPDLERYTSALPRLGAAWTPQSVAKDDPLQLERVAYHTLVTSNLDRSLHFLTQVLNGKVIHRAGPTPEQPEERVYVHFADTIIEYVSKHDGEQAFDQYTQITLRTLDLSRARQHLAQNAIALIEDGSEKIVTDPKDSLGARWGFVTSYVKGDPRF